MRPFPINQSFPARPITAIQKRSARWSAGTSKTLREAQKISRPGALRLTQPDRLMLPVMNRHVDGQILVFTNVKVQREERNEHASVRIFAALSADAPVRLKPARAEARAATEPSPAGSQAAGWSPAEGGRSAGAGPSFRIRAGFSCPSTRARRSSAARRAVVAVGSKNRVDCRSIGSALAEPALAGQLHHFAGLVRTTCAIQTLPERAKENCVLLTKNTGVFL